VRPRSKTFEFPRNFFDEVSSCDIAEWTADALFHAGVKIADSGGTCRNAVEPETNS